MGEKGHFSIYDTQNTKNELRSIFNKNITNFKKFTYLKRRTNIQRTEIFVNIFRLFIHKTGKFCQIASPFSSPVYIFSRELVAICVSEPGVNLVLMFVKTETFSQVSSVSSQLK